MTIHVSDSVVIARSAAEVFAFVADHQNLPAWTVGVRTSQRLTAGPPGNGSRYKIEGKLLGRTIRSSYQVTAFDPGRGFDGTMTSPLSSSARVAISSAMVPLHMATQCLKSRNAAILCSISCATGPLFASHPR